MCVSVSDAYHQISGLDHLLVVRMACWRVSNYILQFQMWLKSNKQNIREICIEHMIAKDNSPTPPNLSSSK